MNSKKIDNCYFIDIGNTRIKYGKAITPFTIQYSQHLALRDLFCDIKNAAQLLITAGRSDSAQNALNEILAFAHKRAITTRQVTTNTRLLAVNYSDISQFGVDRFLHLLAGKKRYRENFCIVSAGTAITLDFYTQQHIGGMILPGLGSAKSLLAEKAGLPQINYPVHSLGSDTASCIGAGIYLGYQNLIEKSIENIANEQQTDFHIIFTGGDAGVLCKNHCIVPTLLFEGMLEYGTHLIN